MDGPEAPAILCEEIVPLACTGPADDPSWLAPDEAETLLTDTRPEANLVKTAINQQVERLLAALPKHRMALQAVARERAEAQLTAHRRVREASKAKRGRPTVEPAFPVDILGAYVLLPRISPV